MTQQFTVREARERLRPPMTQAILADTLGIDQTYISLIERGLRTPSVDLKQRLAKALKIRPVQLRFSEPQPAESVDRPSDRAGHKERRAS